MVNRRRTVDTVNTHCSSRDFRAYIAVGLFWLRVTDSKKSFEYRSNCMTSVINGELTQLVFTGRKVAVTAYKYL